MRSYNYYQVWRNFQFNTQEILIAIIVLTFILAYGFFKSVRKSESSPLYQHYFTGLIVKMAGSLSFALIYALYYTDGGDTIAYFYGADALKNLFYQNPSAYLTELWQPPSIENFFNHYNESTGWPPEWLYRSSRHFFVCKAASVLCICIPGSFLGVSFVMGFISYTALWRLYTTLTHHFPEYSKNLRLGILFLPSTLFWCSGIMKDTLVLAGVCWIVHETDLFLRPNTTKHKARFVLRLLIWGWLIFSCKPYIIIGLAPAWLLWLNYTTLSKIKSTVLKYILLPILFIGGTLVTFQLYAVSTAGSEFSPENAIDQALVVRNDFANNSTYGTNRYKATVVEQQGTGMLAAIPEAIIAGLFRPFIWEARSPFIFISSVENLFILLYFLYAMYKLRIFGFSKFIRSHPLILFSMIFTLFVALIVGFTTIIFGTLVRFRTPFLPFFVSILVIASGKIKSLRIIRSYSINKF
jgi:hypothetical protein